MGAVVVEVGAGVVVEGGSVATVVEDEDVVGVVVDVVLDVVVDVVVDVLDVVVSAKRSSMVTGGHMVDSEPPAGAIAHPPRSRRVTTDTTARPFTLSPMPVPGYPTTAETVIAGTKATMTGVEGTRGDKIA